MEWVKEEENKKRTGRRGEEERLDTERARDSLRQAERKLTLEKTNKRLKRDEKIKILISIG